MTIEGSNRKIGWFENGQVAEALETAAREGKPIFADLWAPGCKGCEAMERRTYVDPAAAAFLNDFFVPVKYDTHSPDEDFRRLTGGGLFLWTPTLIVLDPRRREVRRAVGYLRARALMAELSLSLGQIALSRRDPGAALRAFKRVIRDRSVPQTAAEALYWAGVAAFYAEGKRVEALEPYWRAIGARFPETPWRSRADVLDPHRPTAGTAVSVTAQRLGRFLERAGAPIRRVARILRPAHGDVEGTSSGSGWS